MSLHHKTCGGELYIKRFSYYGEDMDGSVFGMLPDWFCRACGEEIIGDAQIKESVDDIFKLEVVG